MIMTQDSSPQAHLRRSASWTWVSRTKIDPLKITVKDTKADRFHPAVRLVTYTGSTVKQWPWHHVYGGNGASGEQGIMVR